MAKDKKAKKKASKKRRQDDVASADEHVLDRLYVVIDSRKGADPESSYTARLFSRGRAQIAKKLGENIGQSVVVDNKGGAGGNIAHQFVANAAPDGSVLLFGSVGRSPLRRT